MALTKDEAIKVAVEWVANKAQAPKAYGGWNQFRSLMDQLAALCVAESLANDESKYQLCERLAKAHDILSNVRYAGAPEIATRYWWDRDQKLSPEDQKTVDKAERTVWTRRDPRRSFEEGYESEYYTAFDRDAFYGTVADYLKEPWLQHPYLDWIMVDMLVTRELSLFGEQVKLRSPLALGYFRAKGNLLKTIFWGGLWAIALPAGAIYGAFHFGYGGLGTGLSQAYGAAVAAWLALTLLRYIAGKTHPLGLWNEMYEVWKLLQGPIVNPTLVREVMAKTRDEGAVWDTPAWSIVDRVIQHDAAVWFIQLPR